MKEAPTKRAPRLFGLRPETVNEVIALFIVLASVLVFLALVSQRADGNLIGRIGSCIAIVLTFVFGQYVAYAIPLITLLVGIKVWRRHSFEKMPARIVGAFLASTTICALAAIGYADSDTEILKEKGFWIGGALGNFLMHKECLYMKGYLGIAGSYIFFVGVLVASVMLATDKLLRHFFDKMVLFLLIINPTNWIHYLAFWKHVNFAGLLFADGVDDGALAELSAETAPIQPSRSRPPVGPEKGLDTLHFQGTMPVSSGAGAGRSGSPLATPAPAAQRPVSVTIPISELGSRSSEKPAVTPKQKPVPERPVMMSAATDDLVSLIEAESANQDSTFYLPYEIPGIQLLNVPPRVDNRMTADEVGEISDTLEKTLAEFGINAQVVQVTQGPTVTRFELQPAPGVKVSRIASLENDIAMCLRAESVRIIAPIPGKAAVGLEVPNRKAAPVYLRELLSTEAFRTHGSPLAFALGKTIAGEPYICDLAAMPHILIAGTTGSGKSVCLNSIICSILFRMQPEKVKFIMIDPKRVELNVYQAIPHLLAPVVCEPRKAAAALQWAIEQMEDRYKKLAALGVRNIDGYNAIVQSREPHPKAIGRQLEYMPHIVIVVDELADLMLIARNEVEDSIIRLAQMSRAVGMHLIIATQRPSVNVITGIIKANFPCRVAFQVSSKVDSRTILDMNGAETLLGRGDMLFSPGGSPKPQRLQGCFVSDEEVERVADFVRAQQKASYLKNDFATAREIVNNDELALDGIDADESSVPPAEDTGTDMDDYSYQQERLDGKPVTGVSGSERVGERTGERTSDKNGEDSDSIDEELFRQAVKLILTYKKASVSLLQRKLKIGFARAGRVMDMIEEAGIVGPNLGSKVREIIVDPDEYLQKMDSDEMF